MSTCASVVVTAACTYEQLKDSLVYIATVCQHHAVAQIVYTAVGETAALVDNQNIYGVST